MRYIYIFFLLLVFVGIEGVTAQVVESHTITSPPQSPVNIVSTTGKVVFKAQEEIVLKYDAGTNVGFSAETGSDFHGYIIPISSFANLKNSLDGSFYVTIDNMLHFVYEEKYKDGSLNYKIYDYKRNSTTLKPLPTVNKILGTNYISINVSDLLAIPTRTDGSDAYYVLEVVDEKGLKQVLRFKFVPVI